MKFYQSSTCFCTKTVQLTIDRLRACLRSLISEVHSKIQENVESVCVRENSLPIEVEFTRFTGTHWKVIHSVWRWVGIEINWTCSTEQLRGHLDKNFFRKFYFNKIILRDKKRFSHRNSLLDTQKRISSIYIHVYVYSFSLSLFLLLLKHRR